MKATIAMRTEALAAIVIAVLAAVPGWQSILSARCLPKISPRRLPLNWR